MNILRKASHVLVCGKSGTGKTTYLLRYMMGSHHKRVFGFDHQSEFHARLKTLPINSFEAIRSRAETQRLNFYDYALEYPGQLQETFCGFCDEVFDISRTHLEPSGHDCLFVCDEVQKCSNPSDCPLPLKNIVQTGRRFGVDSLLASQQPNRISNEIREQVTELVMFNLIDKNSLKFCDEMGIDTAEIQHLAELHYIWYNLKTGEKRNGQIKHRPKS